MNPTAIDQLFQRTTSTPLGREPSRSGQPKGDLFRSHLERATETTETKPPASKNASESKRTNEDEPVEPQTGQQETSTDEQQQASAPSQSSESSESTAETAEDSQTTEQVADEVILSEAVVAQPAEVAVTTEQVVSAETVVETPLNGNQRNSNQQESEQQVATPLTETTNPTTENQAIALEAALLGEGVKDGEDETASDTPESIIELAGETNSTKTPSFQNAEQIVAATEAKKPQTSSGSQPSVSQLSVSQPSVGQQRQDDEVLEASSENNAQEHSPQSSKGKVEVPSTTATNDFAVAADVELVKSSLNSTTETAANTSSSSNTTSTNDTAAVAGRTFGNVLAGKSAEAASSAVESQSPETPTINQARFVQRVGGAIRSAQQRDGQIQLRLSPPELGTLRINIALNEGVLTARLEVETAAARTVLLDNLPALRERLAEQEIRIEKFDVDVGREGQQQADTSDTAEDHQANRSQTNKTSSRAKAVSLATTDPDSSPTSPITASGLDVRI